MSKSSVVAWAGMGKARHAGPGGIGELRQSVKVGKLNLVDLAGSERVHITGATGHFTPFSSLASHSPLLFKNKDLPWPPIPLLFQNKERAGDSGYTPSCKVKGYGIRPCLLSLGPSEACTDVEELQVIYVFPEFGGVICCMTMANLV